MRHALRTTALGALVATGLALAAACGGSTGAGLTITGLGWLEENIDPSFFSSPPPSGQTAFYDFWIHYGGDIAFTDVQYARVYLPNGSYWTLSMDSNLFDATNKTIGGYGHWFVGSQTNVLPIGYLQVEVKLVDGVTSTYTAYIPAPASTTATPYTSMYSQDLIQPPAESVPMIKRAVIGAANTSTASTSTMSITFSVDDANVYDGFVWFYDAADTYLGGFFFFRDPATGLLTAPVETFLTDGTMNTVTLHPADIAFAAGARFDQIKRFRVVLTDGGQYGLQASGQLRLDCRSVSAVASLTLP